VINHFEQEESRIPEVPLPRRIAVLFWILLAVGMLVSWYPSYNNAYALGVRHVSWSPGTIPGTSSARHHSSATLNVAMGRVGLHIGHGTFDATSPSPEEAGWHTDIGVKPDPQNQADRGYLGGFSYRTSSNTGVEVGANPGFSTRFGVPIYFVLGIIFFAVRAHVFAFPDSPKQARPQQRPKF
jgi:hypothetical protein